MKILKVLSFILILALLNCCNSVDDMSESENTLPCDVSLENEKFKEIDSALNYQDVETIMEAQGDNFRNDVSDNSIIKYYKWIYCDETFTYIQTWFLDDEIILKEKTFQDDSCSDGITEQNFASIENGDSYESVSSLLNNIGDNFRIDYKYDPIEDTIKYYKWYDCNDSDRNIEV